MRRLFFVGGESIPTKRIPLSIIAGASFGAGVHGGSVVETLIIDFYLITK